MLTTASAKAAALKLPARERADLARKLLASLDPREKGRSNGRVDEAWSAEIEARLAAVDRGEVRLLDWRKSLLRIGKSLRRNGSK